MITEKCTCDKCKKVIIDLGEGIYILSHESLDSKPIMGDNRIPREKHFCRDCFGIYLVPILVELTPSPEGI